jgi:hypothetical protein
MPVTQVLRGIEATINWEGCFKHSLLLHTITWLHSINIKPLLSPFQKSLSLGRNSTRVRKYAETRLNIYPVWSPTFSEQWDGSGRSHTHYAPLPITPRLLIYPLNNLRHDHQIDFSSCVIVFNHYSYFCMGQSLQDSCFKVGFVQRMLIESRVWQSCRLITYPGVL